MTTYTDIDISALITVWGAQYKDQGQTAKTIKDQLFKADDISAEFRVIPWKNSTYQSVYSTIDEVLQAFSIPFTAKSTSTFKPHEQKLGEFKIDVLRTPDTLWPSFLGFLREIEKPERKKWGFIKWVIMHQLLPKAQEDFITSVAYWGWQLTGYDAAPNVDGATFEREFSSNDTAQPANGSMDGVKKQLAKFIANGRVSPIMMGALSNDPVTFCEQMEAFVLEISLELRKKIDFLWMREDLVKRYRDGRRAKYNMYYAQEQDLSLIDGSTIRVKATESQEGSDQIWGTPKMNRVKPTILNLKNRFDVQGFERQVKLLNNWSYVLTFDVPEFIVTNEHQNTITAQNIVDHYTE